jgi:hypothetical protein
MSLLWFPITLFKLYIDRNFNLDWPVLLTSVTKNRRRIECPLKGFSIPSHPLGRRSFDMKIALDKAVRDLQFSS